MEIDLRSVLIGAGIAAGTHTKLEPAQIIMHVQTMTHFAGMEIPSSKELVNVIKQLGELSKEGSRRVHMSKNGAKEAAKAIMRVELGI